MTKVLCSFCDEPKDEVIGTYKSDAKICAECVVKHMDVLVRRLASSRARERAMQPAAKLIDAEIDAPYRRVRDLESALSAIEARCEDCDIQDSDLARVIAQIARSARHHPKAT